MTWQDVEIDIADLKDSRRADRLEMAELRSRAQDIEACIWEIERHFAQRVPIAIEVIAIYETKSRMVHDAMDWVIHQGVKVEKNANNKRKWEVGHGGKSGKQQNKRRKVIRESTIGPSNKKGPAPSKMKELSDQLKELSDKGIYKTKFLILGSSGFVCQEEGWIL
ncbi:hypothetical protein Tco_0462104 [Tanacetum coccineum]